MEGLLLTKLNQDLKKLKHEKAKACSPARIALECGGPMALFSVPLLLATSGGLAYILPEGFFLERLASGFFDLLLRPGFSLSIAGIVGIVGAVAGFGAQSEEEAEIADKIETALKEKRQLKRQLQREPNRSYALKRPFAEAFFACETNEILDYTNEELKNWVKQKIDYLHTHDSKTDPTLHKNLNKAILEFCKCFPEDKDEIIQKIAQVHEQNYSKLQDLNEEISEINDSINPNSLPEPTTNQPRTNKNQTPIINPKKT